MQDLYAALLVVFALWNAGRNARPKSITPIEKRRDYRRQIRKQKHPQYN